MHFNNIKDEDFKNIYNLQSKTKYDGCEYSKTYLKAWGFYNYDSIQIAYENGAIFLRFIPLQKYFDEEIKMEHLYLPPLATIDKIVEAFDMIGDYCKENKETLFITEVPQEYVDLLDKERYNCDCNVIYDEYLYNPSDLISFAGKKYHSKRNHVANFNKNYSYVFREYTAADYDAVEKLAFDWESKKDYAGEDLIEERDEEIAIRRELESVSKEENVVACVIEIDSRIVGFTLGEITPSNIGIVHLEKCDVSFEGIYSKIVNEFAKKYFSGVRYVNRQEDLGIEGLRKSKLSYHPIRFCKKFDVTIQQTTGDLS